LRKSIDVQKSIELKERERRIKEMRKEENGFF
jgi:hypothetical protein